MESLELMVKIPKLEFEGTNLFIIEFEVEEQGNGDKHLVCIVPFTDLICPVLPPETRGRFVI